MYDLQQITQHQERFVQMLNEPRAGDPAGHEAESEGQGSPPGTNYIQVTPQEKEAIERVSCLLLFWSKCELHSQSVFTHGSAK